MYFSKVSLLCVSHPGRPRQCSLSHFHILEFLELFLTTLIQSLRPEMEFRMLEELLIAEIKKERKITLREESPINIFFYDKYRI